ncbi:MAG TPA: hypothetical protein VLC09_12930 [Polyangiaceae bacterium]|nr:hypothetical protein [Polyangiaceae bacterium]
MRLDVPDFSGPLPGEGVRYQCVHCSKLSPPAESSFTLISSRFGWRLGRRLDRTSGEWQFEWHCPDCWSQKPPEHLRRR